VLCKSASKEQISPSTPRPILALLERPWFRRIWVCNRTTNHRTNTNNLAQVLQKVAVARQILIKYGPNEMDGSVFCSGLDASNLPYDTCPGLRDLVTPSHWNTNSRSCQPCMNYRKCKLQDAASGPSDRHEAADGTV
jgi:hypothetical protein